MSANGSAVLKNRKIRVGIVGAGFGGVGMGIQLKRHGFYDFKIFEQRDGVGGVWRANTYPGAACDVPSHLYSFSFARGHQWSRRYAPQPEIVQYMNEITDEFGIRDHIQFGTAVESADFDEAAGTWTITTGDGASHEFEAVVTACGQLTNPAWPDLHGIEGFEGKSFHSADWDHDYDLAGKEVAVVGSGASAIQFVPIIAEQAKKLTVYQRTAPWILPKLDRPYPEIERALMKAFPARVSIPRAGLFGFFEGLTYAFTGNDKLMDQAAKLANLYREKSLADDPELLARCTPDYEMGCKRVLFTSDWYSTMKRPNVELVTEPIETVTAGGIVTPSGERPADTIIWGTGFRSHDFVAPMKVTGLEGKELNEVWGERPEAYLGTVVTGFPNLFVMYGPNTNHGSGSVPYTHECQYNLVLDALKTLRAGTRWLQVKPETQAGWREEIARRSVPTRWTQPGCTNWYINGEGVNTNNWIGPWLEFKRRTDGIELSEYELVG